MNAYPESLRKTIVEAPRRGTGKSEAARSSGVSPSSVKRYVRMAPEGRPLAPNKRCVEANLDRYSREAVKNAIRYIQPEAAKSLREAHLLSGTRGRRR
jgi:hypothetical protein